MISYGLSNAFFWHWCGSESLKIPKLDLSAFVRCDERRDRWSDGAQPTSSPATSSPRFAAAELDLGYAPPDGHHAGVAESSSLFQRTLDLEVVLDPQCEDPESRPFPKGFLDKILTRRTELLASVLTIWRWGRQNAVNLTRGLPLGSFETWAEWVRDPLLTLGCQDPVEQVSAAKANDPRRRRVAELFATWWEHHQGQPMRAATLADPVRTIIDPQARGRQYVATRLVQLAGTRAAGFVLTRQHRPASGLLQPTGLSKLSPTRLRAWGIGLIGVIGTEKPLREARSLLWVLCPVRVMT
jgi:hypothetical protein